MPTFRITAGGKSYNVTAPDQAAAVAAFQKYSSGQNGAAPAYQPQTFNSPNGTNTLGLAMPGTSSPPNPAPTQRFGFTSADDPNPLPAIAAGADAAVGAIPIAGPMLQQWRDNMSAAAYTAGGQPTTPQQSRAGMNDTVRQNPIPAAVGQTVGSVAPYALGAELPIAKTLLGFEGPMLQRFGMGLPVQYGINDINNQVHGQSPTEAATNAGWETAAGAPFMALGKGRLPAGERADAVKALQSEGIDLTAGQQRGSKAMMNVESQIGGAGAQNMRDKQLAQLTQAALRRAGVDATSANPHVMQAAFDKAGKNFDFLAAHTSVKLDAPLQNDLLKVVTDYQGLTGTPAPILETMVNRIGALAQQNGGFIRGDSYGKLITDIRTAAASSSDVTLKNALGSLRNVIDDAVERTLPGRTRAAWQSARRQYANLKVIQDAVDGAGEYAARGYVTPESLNGALRTGDTTGYVKGRGDLNALSRAAVVAMPRLADSGTASRTASYVLGGMGLPAAATAYGMTQSLPAALGAGAASLGGALLPYATGRMMMTPAMRALLARGTATPAVAARGLAPQLLSQVPSLAQIGQE